MNFKSIKTKTAVTALCLCLAAAAAAQLPPPPKKNAAAARRVIHTPAPDFTLIDQEGRPFTMSALRGKTVLATFIYTTCPDVCPLFTARFAQLQRALDKEKRGDYFFVSVTTDPARNTPKVLKSYARRFGADLRTWAFLTGKREDLANVWKAFGVSVKQGEKGLHRHTGLTTVIDGRGFRRIEYYGDRWAEKDLLKDVAELTAQGSPGQEAQKNITDLRIEKGKIADGTKVIRVKQGETVTLRWTTDASTTLHLHGYEVEKRVTPGESAPMSFKAHATGRFPIEAHVAGDKKGGHHALLYIEVLPR